MPPSSARFPQRRNDIHRSTPKKHQIHLSIEWVACQSPSPAPFPHRQTANTRVTRLNRPFYLELRRSERLRGYMDCLQAKQTIKSKPPARASLSSLSTRTLNTGGAVVKMTGGATRPLHSPLHSARRPPPDTFFRLFFSQISSLRRAAARLRRGGRRHRGRPSAVVLLLLFLLRLSWRRPPIRPCPCRPRAAATARCAGR